jgi:O-methyltransferase
VRRSLRSGFKYLLTRVGALVSTRTIDNVNSIANYLELGRWMRAKEYRVSHRVDRREQLFDMIGAAVGDKEVLYLEFGVFEGDATRYWSRLLRNPNSKLHGFDSFEGLPETWTDRRPKGYFSVQGAIPQIDDDRVQFFKGWFQDTLPDYKWPAHEVLVLNMDADLYSSTLFVLNTLEALIVPGSYIYFDEFNHRSHELRASDEFMTRTSMRFSLVGVTRTMEQVVFKRTS